MECADILRILLNSTETQQIFGRPVDVSVVCREEAGLTCSMTRRASVPDWGGGVGWDSTALCMACRSMAFDRQSGMPARAAAEMVDRHCMRDPLHFADGQLPQLPRSGEAPNGLGHHPAHAGPPQVLPHAALAAAAYIAPAAACGRALDQTVPAACRICALPAAMARGRHASPYGRLPVELCVAESSNPMCRQAVGYTTALQLAA